MANVTYEVTKHPIEDIIGALEREMSIREKVLPKWGAEGSRGWTPEKVEKDLECFRDAINILKWNKGAAKSFGMMIKKP